MAFASCKERTKLNHAIVRCALPLAAVMVVGLWLVGRQHYSWLSLVFILTSAVAISAWVSSLGRSDRRGTSHETELQVCPSPKDGADHQAVQPLPNETLASIFRWIPIGIVYYGLGRKVLYCNEEFTRIYGFEEGELIGRVPPLPEARKEEWSKIEQNLHRGIRFSNLETVRVRKDGTEFRAFISGVPLFNDMGALIGFIGVIVESEDLPQPGGVPYDHILALAESSTDFLLLLDPTFRIVYANPGFVVAVGIDDGDLHKTDILGYFARDDRGTIEQALGETFLPGNNHFVVQAHLQLNADGGVIPVSLEFYPIFRADLETPTAIACIIHDLQRESELFEKLQQTASESRTLFEAAPIGIVKVNTKGYPIASNPKFQQMLGYGPEELIKLPFASLVHPIDLPRGRALFLDLTAGNIERYQIVKRLVRKDGTVVHTSMTVSLVRDAAGNPSHTISMVAEVPAGTVADNQP